MLLMPFAMTLLVWAGDVQVKKVDKEKFNKFTPEQKEKFGSFLNIVQ